MKLLQIQWWILTLWKKIIHQPLDKSIRYKELVQAIEEHDSPSKWPETYYRDQIKSLVDRVTAVLDGNYAKSWFSNTSAYTRWAHTYFWEDPDIINNSGLETDISTKWIISLSSWWYVNNAYDIQELVKAKNELALLLSN